jgi:nucleoside-diphosphate-sugar epimerase
MKVLVTGGTGNVGRAAVARLVRHGHQVRVIGRRPGIEIAGAEYRSCDITDFDALREQVKGMEAVVHLAAIPHPSLAPGQEIFRINCGGTFNVYRAAADEGIGRIVTASSINALGYNFGIKDFDLCYFPIDEEHPTFTTDPYSFSKQVLEEIAAYFWRREGISSVCLRLPAVYELDDAGTGLKDFVMRSREAYEELLALPEATQRARARHVVATFEVMRAQRAWEKPLQHWGMDLPDAGLMFGRSNFWTSLNADDSAQAIEKGLLAEYCGSHPLYITDNHNFAGIDTAVLANIFFPEVTTWKRHVKGTESLVSIDRARTLIGFEPEHSISQWF